MKIEDLRNHKMRLAWSQLILTFMVLVTIGSVGGYVVATALNVIF